MLTTYRVVIFLRAQNRDQVLAAIEAAFGSITAGNAKIYNLDPVPFYEKESPPDKREP